MDNRFPLLVATLLLSSHICACVSLPNTAGHGVSTPDPNRILAALTGHESAIKSFRGIGELSLITNGGKQRTRLAWIGSQPGDLRIEILGLWGQPNVTFLVKETTFYAHSHQDDRCLKAKATTRNVSRIMSIPMREEDLFTLLSGNAPVLPFHYAEMGYSEEDHQRCLSLYRRWRRLVERIWMKDDGKAVARLEVFDGSGHLQYMAAFQQYGQVQGVLTPKKITVSDEQGHLLSLEVERFWTNVEVPPEAFTLPVPCRSDPGS